MTAPAIALAAEKPAKQLFGSQQLPASGKARAVGFYSKGCMAGAVGMPLDGPDWQVMRLSRNRRWGHPDLIAILEDLSVKAKQGGWNGLLVGDISQPRGGPMLTGHASHQVGLDADIWLTPMPNRRLTYQEREEMSAIDALKAGSVRVDDSRWTRAHTNLIRAAASYSKVERILVHPGIKKKLCDSVQGDRKWLAKVRPYYSHNYHFHMRIGCPPGSPGCKPQKEVNSGDGCDASLQWWFDVALKPKKVTKPPKKDQAAKKPKPPRQMMLSDLPGECTAILGTPAVARARADFQVRETAFSAPVLDIPKLDPLAALSSKPIEASSNAAKASTVTAAESVTIGIPSKRPAN